VKSAQKPHPPIVIGGSAKNVLKRIVDQAVPGDRFFPCLRGNLRLARLEAVTQSLL
jgi:hypothetical protein